ncbi:MAG: HDIG domain-containing protein [Bacteroidetes bacterium]|uniref:HDIG domain-containing protein n=1 Tax=Candidatus Cryptobacteroides intestinavium TaxID=2840766 RepID=A0A9D9EP15_9BACT|nr:HDIG domain-containing protein [Candidatus Cryptobacteroides intestinavium]
MHKVRFPRDFKVYIPLIVLFVFLLLLMPRTGNFNYDYRIGSPWMYETLIAQFDFPVLKTEAQLQEEREAAGSGIIPYYKYSEDVAGGSIRSIEDAELGKFDTLKTQIQEILSSIYSRGVISDIEGTADSWPVIYIQRDRRASRYPVSEIYKVSEARAELAAGLRHIGLKCDVDSLCRYSGLYSIVVPNLLFDQQTTDLVHDEAVNYISPTSGIVNAGQLIVSHGEIVTAEVKQLLDSYKAEYEDSIGYGGPLALLWGGNAVLSLLLVAVLFFTVFYTSPGIFSEFNSYCYLIVVFSISALVTFIVEKAGHENIYLVPFTLIALYLVAFFKTKVVYPVYVISLLPLLIFAHNGVEMFVMYLVAGIVAIFSFGYFNKGWQQFVTAFFVFLSLVLTFIAFNLIDGMRDIISYRTVLYLALGSLFSVAGYPLVYLFERIFMLVSNSRLVELSDSNNKLLRELAHKAPGTFQHCLQVMNMVDAAARAIDANVQLVRCGALYHDIGKIANPLCFIENEASGTNYHEELTPIESAREIIKHVSDGLAIADKAGLPDVVKDFILTHHGTTCTAYFYNKYLEAGGDPAKADDFYYKGRKPWTKEQSILMLCDTIEAASRSLKDFSQQSVSDFVDRIFNSKVRDGQFEEADISLKELHILKNVLKDYLQQVHHARVVYPKRQLRRG